MRAMILDRQAPVEEKPLRMADVPTPTPDDHEVLVKVSVCGACHTDLDEVEGRLEPTLSPIVPGHQVVGHVIDKGKAVTKFEIGERHHLAVLQLRAVRILPGRQRKSLRAGPMDRQGRPRRLCRIHRHRGGFCVSNPGSVFGFTSRSVVMCRRHWISHAPAGRYHGRPEDRSVRLRGFGPYCDSDHPAQIP